MQTSTTECNIILINIYNMIQLIFNWKTLKYEFVCDFRLKNCHHPYVCLASAIRILRKHIKTAKKEQKNKPQLTKPKNANLEVRHLSPFTNEDWRRNVRKSTISQRLYREECVSKQWDDFSPKRAVELYRIVSSFAQWHFICAIHAMNAQNKPVHTQLQNKRAYQNHQIIIIIFRLDGQLYAPRNILQIQRAC